MATDILNADTAPRFSVAGNAETSVRIEAAQQNGPLFPDWNRLSDRKSCGEPDLGIRALLDPRAAGRIG